MILPSGEHSFMEAVRKLEAARNEKKMRLKNCELRDFIAQQRQVLETKHKVISISFKLAENGELFLATRIEDRDVEATISNNSDLANFLAIMEPMRIVIHNDIFYDKIDVDFLRKVEQVYLRNGNNEKSLLKFLPKLRCSELSFYDFSYKIDVKAVLKSMPYVTDLMFHSPAKFTSGSSILKKVSKKSKLGPGLRTLFINNCSSSPLTTKEMIRFMKTMKPAEASMLLIRTTVKVMWIAGTQKEYKTSMEKEFCCDPELHRDELEPRTTSCVETAEGNMMITVILFSDDLGDLPHILKAKPSLVSKLFRCISKLFHGLAIAP